MTDEKKPSGLAGLDFIRYRLSPCLQGYIHSVYDPSSSNDNRQPIIIKQIVKQLAIQRVSYKHAPIQEDIKEEIRVLRHLSNLNDVDPAIRRTVNDSVWEDDDNYYYAMELCAFDLFTFVSNSFRDGIMSSFVQKRNKSNVDPCTPWIHQIQHIFRQLVRCVAYLHSHGIAHRDFSLENVMILDEESMQIKIIDWGVAYDMSQHNDSWIATDRVGKHNYMSPEVFHKYYDRKYDARAGDIWSLGIMLFMVLTNVMPINRINVHQSTQIVQYFLKGQVKAIIKWCDKEHCFNDEIIDLLDKIFKIEKQRITMDELIRHPFVRLDGEN
eukprot:467804_1